MSHALMRREWGERIALAVCVLICLAVGAMGSVFTSTSVTSWYPSLQKPAWTPPGWIFGPVWTVLYLSMAVAAWLVWLRRDVPPARAALVLFAVQLALNMAWSLLFFGLRAPLAALADIVLLWVAVATTMILFWRVVAPAGWILLPYLGWVTFAAALNAEIWRMNP